MFRLFAFLVVLVLSFPALADCYSWPLRTVDGRMAYDADTVYVTMPGLPQELSAMSVRVAGIDAPEIRGKCESERAKAIEARDFVAGKLAGARSIQFCGPAWDKFGGRVRADVQIDGESLGAVLLERGLARPYDGGKRGGWCP